MNRAKMAAAGDLMYEIDSLYVSTEMILTRQFREPPLDGLLLEACLLHFRVVWDFFYRAEKEDTDVVVSNFIPTWKTTDPPPQLKRIRKWLNVMLAHLTTYRSQTAYRKGAITEDDIRLIRDHTKQLFEAFQQALTGDQRKALVNPLATKFAAYERLSQ